MEVHSIKDLGPQFTKNLYRMVGQDGAYSIPLQDGNTLWFFGDTLIGMRTPGESLWYPGGERIGSGSMAGTAGIEQMLTNTALILKDRTGKEGFHNYSYIEDSSGSLKQLIPYTTDEDSDQVRIWCFHGIDLGEKIVLFYQKVKMQDEDVGLPVHFANIGSGLTVGSSRDWEFNRIIHNGSDIIWGKEKPQFASSILKGKTDSFLYLYGVKMNEQKVQQCYLARVMPENIDSVENYEYFTGNSNGYIENWNTDVNKAVPLFDGMPNELSVSWNEYLGSYLAVHSLEIWGEIVARTAPNPWGPWSDYTVLHTVEAERKLDLPYPPLIYAAKEHPELAGDNGKIIYITYIEFEEYFPHLLEITLR